MEETKLKAIKLIGIKIIDKDIIYISEISGYNKDILSFPDYIINGKQVNKTFKSNWGKIDSFPKKVEKYVKVPDINKRFVLKDETLANEKIPYIISYDEATYIDEDGFNQWKSKYVDYRSLYEFKSDKVSDKKVSIPYDYEQILELNEIKEYQGFKYETPRKYKDCPPVPVTEKNIKYSIIDSIVSPDILLPSKKCNLSSEESYAIVRQYIKDNIDNRYANITSDYGFCFDVSKKIKLYEPEEYTVDVNQAWFSKRKRKPKYETRYRKYREIKIFSMAPKEYQSYPVISGFIGENQDDLKNNIDDYCKNLIEFINEPLIDCPNCKGKGVVIDGKERT